MPNLIIALLAAVLLTGSVSAQEAVRTAVFGPRTFTKSAEPLNVHLDFSLKPLIHGPYRLELHSADVTDVKVTVNGFEHYDFRDFRFENNQSRTVLLAAFNTIRVELKG